MQPGSRSQSRFTHAPSGFGTRYPTRSSGSPVRSIQFSRRPQIVVHLFVITAVHQIVPLQRIQRQIEQHLPFGSASTARLQSCCPCWGGINIGRNVSVVIIEIPDRLYRLVRMQRAHGFIGRVIGDLCEHFFVDLQLRIVKQPGKKNVPADSPVSRFQAGHRVWGKHRSGRSGNR